MNRRHFRIVLVVLLVAALLATVLSLTSCKKNENGGQGGGSTTDPSGNPVSSKNATKLIITLDGKALVEDGKEITYNIEKDEPLTIRPQNRAHYDFAGYTFSDPENHDIVYESDKGGQNWSVTGSKTKLPLIWKWDNVKSIKIEANYTPMSYQIYYSCGIPGNDAPYALEYHAVKTGEEFTEDFITLLSSEAKKYETARPGYKLNGLGSGNPASSVTPNTVIDGETYLVSRKLNGTEYYLDDVNKRCIFVSLWKKDSYSLQVWDYYSGSYIKQPLQEFEYGQTIRLSDYFHPLDHGDSFKYVHIGWNDTLPSSYFGEEAKYTVNATFENNETSVKTVNLYTVYGALPNPNKGKLSVEGLKVSYETNDENVLVSYRYTDATSGDWSELQNGDLTWLAKDTIYTVSVDLYRYYTDDNIKAMYSGAKVFSVKPMEAPALTISGDKITTKDPDKAVILISGEETKSGILSNFDEYFLRTLKSGDYTVRAYVSYEDKNKVLCQSEYGNRYAFTVRDGSSEFILQGVQLFLKVSEIDRTKIESAYYQEFDQYGGEKTGKTDVKNYLNNGTLNLYSNIFTLSLGESIICEVTLLGQDGQVSKTFRSEAERTAADKITIRNIKNDEWVETTVNG